jgi:hypothetical protein
MRHLEPRMAAILFPCAGYPIEILAILDYPEISPDWTKFG